MSETPPEGTPDPTPDESGEPDSGQFPGETEKERQLNQALHAERQNSKTLKAALTKKERDAETQRVASLTEAEQAVEKARKEGRDEAIAELKGDLTRSRVTAAAAAAGFADPADAAGFLDLSGLDTEDDVAAAVAALAKLKPYLLKRTQASLEQGPKGKESSATPADWLREVMS
jgi:hypothetical protein